MKVLLPNTIRLDVHLPAGWSAVTVDASEPIPREHRDAEALVLWGATSAHRNSARHMPRLRFVQTLSAGAESVLEAGFAEGVLLATGSGLHDSTVAEHTVALLLSLVRDLPAAGKCQDRHEWCQQLGGVRELHPTGRVTTLLGTKTMIFGFGRIGQTIAPVLRLMGSSVEGVARRPGPRAGYPVIDFPSAMTKLGGTDILISTLPAARDTDRLIGADVFAALPSRAVIVNVGRGSVVDQKALTAALEAHEISGAALDVTTPEPLPPDDPLWDAPGLVITPHAAGGRPVKAAELIDRNLEALSRGLPITNQVGT